ncbi:hypothetical protein [Photobacterium leiognathi]|uniref:hypothetical protein n=1 Tax=Photobacterium leiognathi TaxID=553611 RepID=UPI00020880CA|nr:hypothetical protein [Photobacterium leiognathi]PSW48339.1 hypothetical protein CTM83_20105 [Photobacterium leiognathi subsp. mandapamensis]GAA03226.1 putative uncharacterized protein [Photobacterium leiognathi subsp. mandapamensis svers.1.1.]
MSTKGTKAPLHAHIDGLCEELNITDKPYTDKTTIEELQIIIDELEAQLPDDSDGIDEGDDLSQTDVKNSDVLIGSIDESDLPSGAVIDDGLDGPEVKSNADGDLLIEAACTVQLISHGNTLLLAKGKQAYVDEDAAMTAVEEQVAFFVAK